MMKRFLFSMIVFWGSLLAVQAQSFKFDFSSDSKVKDGYTKITKDNMYDKVKGYGYDVTLPWDGKSNAPFLFSVKVPDGNYKVTVTLGSMQSAGSTVIRGESRRLFYESVPTKKGELKTVTLLINKRDDVIEGGTRVKLKEAEKGRLTWDEKLTLEFNGDAPRVSAITIDKVSDVPTIFLCGNSTVVDQANEPWASWGQMVPRFLNDKIAVANYAESGLTAKSFIGGKRLDKIMTQIKAGDYLFFEFGHNDQKEKFAGSGAYYSFAYYLKQFIDKARSKGAKPVLVTPTCRRRFEKGKIRNTHGDYPAIIREIAAREKLPVIDLQDMTMTMVNAFGESESKALYVHYPMGTFECQVKELKDDTHFSTFGAYEVAKCVIEGIKKAGLPIVQYIRSDYKGFNPASPDKKAGFKWYLSPFCDVAKPAGN